MSKVSKSMRSYYGGLARKNAWNELADSLNKANFDEVFQKDMSLEQKKQLIHNFQINFKGSLKKRGLDGNQIKLSRANQLVNEICSSPDKMIQKSSFPYRWKNLYLHALRKATNCNK